MLYCLKCFAASKRLETISFHIEIILFNWKLPNVIIDYINEMITVAKWTAFLNKSHEGFCQFDYINSLVTLSLIQLVVPLYNLNLLQIQSGQIGVPFHLVPKHAARELNCELEAVTQRGMENALEKQKIWSHAGLPSVPHYYLNVSIDRWLSFNTMRPKSDYLHIEKVTTGLVSLKTLRYPLSHIHKLDMGGLYIVSINTNIWVED
jgi:hypothetical protein